jgi:hypothetical protein
VRGLTYSGESRRKHFDGTPPPHFYGELVKTPEGCETLAEYGHFAMFADYIQQHGLEDDDLEVIARLKSVLWAVVSCSDLATSRDRQLIPLQGHIGASEGGLPFLEDEYVIQSIVEVAEDSQVYSVRGCVAHICVRRDE